MITPIIYKIPDEFFFRLHHVRPRFKENIEEVLFYVATAISDSPCLSHDKFIQRLSTIIRAFTGNSNLAEKTIQNWRTEISALFAFIQENKNESYPSLMAKRLADHQYLDEFFNYFLLSFQYPAGHIKSHNIIKQIEAGVKFKPCPFILNIFQEGSLLLGKPFSCTAEEMTFCAYFDLRVTRGTKSAREVAKQMIDNRKQKIEYFYDYDALKTAKGDFPSKGDVLRYTADIMDYMVLAGLLTNNIGLYYYLNTDAQLAIDVHLAHQQVFFGEYDLYYNQPLPKPNQITALERNWFDYVNSFDGIESFLPQLTEKQTIDISNLVQEYYNRMNSSAKISTKMIGDYGEMLIVAHEYLRTKEKSNRQHLIQKIPTPLGVGYDLQSIEESKGKRYIEVKTTTSKRAINSNSFKLTPNEWDSAETLGDHYFIYYLVVTGLKKSIFIIQNPVEKCKQHLLSIDENLVVKFSRENFKAVELLEICH